MLFNLQNESDILKAQTDFKGFLQRGDTIELIQKRYTRSGQQNKALHVLFTMMSSQLNEMGLEFHYFGLKGHILTSRYTPEVVKNYFWRPIQISLFDIQSTKKINTQQINDIVDVIVKWFGEKGVLIEFPNVELMIK